MSFGQNPSGAQVPSDLIQLGHIMSAFGVQGWVRVRPYTDGFETLTRARQWWLGTPEPDHGSGEVIFTPLAIQESRPHGKALIALPEGYHDRDQAESLRGHTIWLPRSEFDPLPAGEYYWADLLGCDVYGVPSLDADADADATAEPSVFLGRVSHVFDNGAHAVLTVDVGTLDANRHFTPLRDRRNRPRQRMLPFVEAYVHTVDLDNKKISTSWPEEF